MKIINAGLVSAGGISKSFAARMPALLRTIGPIKATSVRVSRRIANSLRAGYPVEHYQALGDCALLWIALPEAALDRVLGELSREPSLARKMIIVCGAARASRNLPFCSATLDAVPGDERVLVAEGDAPALRELRRLAAAERRTLIEIPSDAKSSYLAGVHLASNLLLPFFGAAVETLRYAGFSRTQATHIAEGLGARTLRSYAKAGKKAWNGAIAIDLRASCERDLLVLRDTDPVHAALYQRGIEQALDYFKE